MKNIQCNLCGSDESVLLFESTLKQTNQPSTFAAYQCTSLGYGYHHAIVKCKNCGLVYANPRWDNNEIIDRYKAVEDPLYLQERAGRVLTFTKHLVPLQKWTGLPNGKTLVDVGAYTGIFVEIAQKAGWNAIGIDPSKWAVENARKRGLNMICGTLETSNIPHTSLDVITMWDVVEHLTDPSSEICHSYNLLKPGGWLVLHTMNIDSLFARIMKKNWPWLMEMHLFYFSPTTLTRLLKNSGFEVKKHETQGRYLSLEYLLSRISPYSPKISSIFLYIAQKLKTNSALMPVNLGDLFTVYAQKPN